MPGSPWCRRQRECALGKRGQGQEAGDSLIQQQRGHRAMAKGKDNDQSDLILGGRGGEKEAWELALSTHELTLLAQHTVMETRFQAEMTWTGSHPVSKPGART